MKQLHQGWLHQLYKTYEHCSAKPEFMTGDNPLLPICHTTQNAHIEVILDDKGNFRTAKVLQKGELATIVPCTEGSAGRSGSKPVNHPLCDKLQYVAGDYLVYGGEVTSGFQKQPEVPYQNFLSQLSDWVKSDYSHPKAAAVYQYINQATLITDLIKTRCLFIGENNKLIKQWKLSELERSNVLPDILGSHYQDFTERLAQEDDPKKHDRIFGEYAPPIYKVIPPGQTVEAALIRWRVETPGIELSASWEDQELFQAWINFYSQREAREDLCMVTGVNTTMASQHPSGIRHGADKAKLISSNDSSGFTFRGRFTDKGGEQACTVSADVTQKAHNALRWLVQRKQAYRFGDQVFVSWAVTGEAIPDKFANTADLWIELDETQANITETTADIGDVGDVGEHYARRLNRMMSGYKADISDTQNVVIMGLDSATPGRMAVTYYRVLEYAEFLALLHHWHHHFAWPQNFSKDKKFTGAPSPRDIAEAAYGRRLDDKLKKATVERLLPCIIDQFPFPNDLLQASIHRVCKRMSMEKREDKWEWNKALGITCAIYRGKNQKENYLMSLETDRTNRDYLFGRLLALADNIEGFALKQSQEDRETNAARLMHRFSTHPFETWTQIELSLRRSYVGRLKANCPDFLMAREKVMDEIMNKFLPDDFSKLDSPLSGEFLLGFHCQRSRLLGDKSNTSTESTSEPAV